MFYTSRFVTADPSAAQAAREGQRRADKAERNTEALQLDVERLLMITEALWMILKEQHGYTDEHLQERVMEIDLRDGRLDGKVAPSDPTKCPACDRPLGRKRMSCIYCGEAVMPGLFDR